MLEKDIEDRVCRYARSKGMLAYKFTSPARAAVPDRLLLSPRGVIFFIEFKRTGQKATPAQQREHTLMRDHNALVFVVDNVEDGKCLIDVMVM
jgi:hypothetical protein